MTKLVSIVIPCFNAEKFLAETLQSALNQSYANTEIIFVDDGSTDKSLEIAQAFACPKLQIFTQENKGASAARNLAFQYSKGHYIQYLDADDLLEEHKIEAQIKCLEGKSENSICSGAYSYFSNTSEQSETSWMNAGNRDYENPIEWLIDSLYERTMFPPLVWLTPRHLIEAAGPWNESLNYNDDPEFFSRVLLQADRILFCASSFSSYRIGNPESLGSQKSEKARISELESLTLRARQVLEKENSERVKKALAYQFSKLNYSLYPDFKHLRTRIEVQLKDLDVVYPKNFGKGSTFRLGKVIGWKLAKRLRKILK